MAGAVSARRPSHDGRALIRVRRAALWRRLVGGAEAAPYERRAVVRYHGLVRALLVEDDATIAEFVVRGLREAGFAVEHAADGDAGLTAATSESYDVAIVDLMLPKRDGLSLIE